MEDVVSSSSRFCHQLFWGQPCLCHWANVLFLELLPGPNSISYNNKSSDKEHGSVTSRPFRNYDRLYGSHRRSRLPIRSKINWTMFSTYSPINYRGRRLRYRWLCPPWRRRSASPKKITIYMKEYASDQSHGYWWLTSLKCLVVK